MPGPLSGVRVVELGTMIAAPLATMILADQGAEVVKVESPGGDPMRPVGLMGPGRNGMSALFAACNRGKRSAVVDLGTPKGREVLSRLVARADVFVENMRPGVAERIGAGEEQLRAARPELIYVSVRGFGETGPLAGAKVYDHVTQAASGVAALQAGPATGGRPALVRNLVCDKVTALGVAQAVTAALFARDRGAGGQRVSLSMLDASVAFLWPDGMSDVALLDPSPEPDPPLLAEAFTVVHTADGAVSVVYVPAIGVLLGRLLGADHLAGDPRFADPGAAAAHAAELWNEIEAAAGRLTTAEVLARMAAADMPCGEVVEPSSLPGHPQVEANGTLVRSESPHLGAILEPAPVARFDATPAAIAAHAPALGEHTDAVLADVGYDAATVEELRRAGAVR